MVFYDLRQENRIFRTKLFLPGVCTAPMCKAEHKSSFPLQVSEYIHPSRCFSWKVYKIKKEQAPRAFTHWDLITESCITSSLIVIPTLPAFKQTHTTSILLGTLFNRFTFLTFISAQALSSQLNQKLLEVREMYLIPLSYTLFLTYHIVGEQQRLNII